MRDTTARSLAMGGVLAAMLVLVLGCGGSDNPTASTSSTSGNNPVDPNSVTIQNFAFSPAILTVKVGTTVTWRNNDGDMHTVTSNTGSELDSRLLGTGATYQHTFNVAGAFPYHCTPHPFMTGSVVVEP